MPNGNWRDLSPPHRANFIQWQFDTAVERNKIGEEQYGNTFQGDPLEHLKEELMDALFYCYQAIRERDEV